MLFRMDNLLTFKTPNILHTHTHRMKSGKLYQANIFQQEENSDFHCDRFCGMCFIFLLNNQLFVVFLVRACRCMLSNLLNLDLKRFLICTYLVFVCLLFLFLLLSLTGITVDFRSFGTVTTITHTHTYAIIGRLCMTMGCMCCISLLCTFLALVSFNIIMSQKQANRSHR